MEESSRPASEFRPCPHDTWGSSSPRSPWDALAFVPRVKFKGTPDSAGSETSAAASTDVELAVYEGSINERRNEDADEVPFGE